MNTVDFLEIAKDICPLRDALVFEGRRWSYEALYERVLKLASGLKELGVGRNDFVGILQVNCNEFVEAYFACAMIGAIFVPLNFRAKAEELQYMINKAEVKVLFVGKRYLEMIAAIRPGLTSVRSIVGIETEGGMDAVVYEDLLKGEAREVREDVKDDDTTILLFTSGTTGRPKAVPLRHDSFVFYALNDAEPANPEVEERCLLAVPFYHVMGLQSLLISVYAGRTIILMRQFDTKQWFEIAERERIERTILVPTMLKRIVEDPDFSKYDLSRLRVITYGAAPMPFEVIKRAIELMPHVWFFNGYGQTESAATLTALGPEDHRIEGTEEQKEKKWRRLRSSIGRPLPDVEIRIVDEEGRVLPPGVTGEIQARSPRVMKGYFKDEEKTQQAFTPDGWLRTGDVGYVDEEGYLYLTGRADDLIIRGGENISPDEVEEVLNSHPKVEESCVIGIPDPEFGEQPFAFCVLRRGEKAQEEEIIEFCRERLSPFKRPRGVVFVESLPKSHMGKLLRRKMKEQYEKMRSKGGQDAEPGGKEIYM